MSDFRIEHLPIADLKPNPRNARLHSQKQLHQIAASIREFGFNSIVVIDEDGVILVGHGRVEAAKLASLPCSRLLHRACLITVNISTLTAGLRIRLIGRKSYAGV